MRYLCAWGMVACLAGGAWAQAPEAQLPSLPATAPAPAPAPVTLPEVNTPSLAPPADTTPAPQPAVTSPAAELPIVPATPLPVATSVPVSGPAYSFGTAPFSIFFTPAQITSMKQALTAYESLRGTKTDGELLVTEEVFDPQTEVIPEPSPYPVFYLGSIVYHAKNDWSVWVNNQRITPKHNREPLRAVNVSADQVRFVWDPQESMRALAKRQQEKSFAPISAIRNKTTPKNTAVMDMQGGKVMFTLKPNQSFSAGHFATFEGRVAPITLPPFPPPAPATITTSGELTPAQAAEVATGVPAAEGVDEKDFEQMLKMHQNLQTLNPNPTTGAAGATAP